MEGRGFYHGDSPNRGYFAEPFPAPDWRKPWTEEGAAWERPPADRARPLFAIDK